jgi:hypothetical protein
MKKFLPLFTLFFFISCSKSLERSNPLDGKTLASISGTTVSNIAATSASVTSTISGDGKASISNKGVVWSTATGPTIALSTRTNDGVGVIGNFNSSLSGLIPFTNYYIRSYATNIVGTAYGPETQFKTLAATPSLTTTSASNILSTSANSGGNISSDNGSVVTARGVVWNTITTPTIDLATKTKDSTGKGAFVSALKPLLPGKLYYARAYATNAIGTAYGNEIQFTTTAIAPTVTTADVSSILTTSATSGGNVTSDGGSAVTARGVVWSTSTAPTITLTTKTIDGSGPGTFVSSITSLTAGKTYYVRAYATNSIGTSYGSELSFSAVALPASVTTRSISNITATTATSGGNVTSEGGGSVTARGVVWGTSSGPTIALATKTTDGTGFGVFTSSLTSLKPATTYYFRAYATNSSGTSYGSETSFTTLPSTPTVSTNALTNITAISATGGGNISSDGGGLVTARGVVWSTTTGPTISLSTRTNDGGGTGAFTSSMTSLSTNTKYYVRAYATNSAGTSYGDEVTLSTLNNLPILVTNDATSITATTAVLNGNVTGDGGSAVTQKGIVWAMTTGPNLSSNLGNLTLGGGLGTIAVGPTGLTPGATYYVKAYATNSNGTAYGNEVTFKTLATNPSILTYTPSNVTGSTALAGGYNIYDGGSAVTAKGVVWSTSTGPTVALATKSNDGTGTSSFTTTVPSLSPVTRYYIRAYVTTSFATAYGPEISFLTTANPPTLSTVAISSITSTSASSGGTITSDGLGSITAKGVVWSTSTEPTIALSTKTSNGSGSSNFTSSITGLAPVTKYYVRSYATNSGGTGYGAEVSFTTLAGLAVLTTSNATSITITSAILGGEVTNEGGAAVSEKGVVWNTLTAPTVSNNKQATGTGLGAFTTSVTTLTRNTKYYVRTYAINASGTSYGPEITFNTLP